MEDPILEAITHQIISRIKYLTSQHASHVSGLVEINKLKLILKAGECDSCAQLAS
jgi:hypothetical protein